MRFTIDRIDHIVLNVTDVEITAAWYQRVLGMEREDFGPDRSHRAEIRRPEDQPAAGRRRSGTWLTGVNDAAGPADVCFITAVGRTR